MSLKYIADLEKAILDVVAVTNLPINDVKFLIVARSTETGESDLEAARYFYRKFAKEGVQKWPVK